MMDFLICKGITFFFRNLTCFWSVSHSSIIHSKISVQFSAKYVEEVLNLIQPNIKDLFFVVKSFKTVPLQYNFEISISFCNLKSEIVSVHWIKLISLLLNQQNRISKVKIAKTDWNLKLLLWRNCFEDLN